MKNRVTIKVFANNKVSSHTYHSDNCLMNCFYNAYTKLLVDNKDLDVKFMSVEVIKENDK